MIKSFLIHAVQADTKWRHFSIFTFFTLNTQWKDNERGSIDR